MNKSNKTYIYTKLFTFHLTCDAVEEKYIKRVGSNKRTGSNKRAGGELFQNLISVPDQIKACRREFFRKTNKRAGTFI